ncbi:F-box protein [Podosphaera aphanis]|nr:F-box protein [Podosphaera aphanis]
MRNFGERAPIPRGGGGGRKTTSQTIISTLKATQMIEKKPVLPAELISAILDLLPVPDLMKFARTSKKMQEMVFEDSRWVKRLKAMGVWNEADARKRAEHVMKIKMGKMPIRHGAEAERIGMVPKVRNLELRLSEASQFDPSSEERLLKTAETTNIPSPYIDRFETLAVSPALPALISPVRASIIDTNAPLNILTEVRSMRGYARMEYGKIHSALAPFYNDLARPEKHQEPMILRIYQSPEQQAQILTQLQKFSRSDWAQGWRQREENLMLIIRNFEKTILHEFELSYDAGDIDGGMRRYAHVLSTLNGGHAAIELFVRKNPIFFDREILASPMSCLNQAPAEGIIFKPCRDFLKKLAGILNEQASIIDRVFPAGSDIFQILLEKVIDDIFCKYISLLLDGAHERNLTSYVKAVPGVFEQSLHFVSTLNPSIHSSQDFALRVKAMVYKVFNRHIKLYLQEEHAYFKKTAESKVGEWESKLTAEDATAESFFMSNFNRQADKKDFLSSFKKVVMMPVNLVSPFGTKQRPLQNYQTQQSKKATLDSPMFSPLSRPQTPNPMASGNRSLSPVPPAAPTDEFAAKAAFMASRLEGISSLFSIEVALDLTHNAKSSIDRATIFVLLSDQTNQEARTQCSAIFVQLLQMLGEGHIKPGFDKAVDHLSKYNPREAFEHKQVVVPLVTFLELVNVGDLICQMIDVFYEQQLCANALVDRNDFLNPAARAKKQFEHMLDDRVAAGLNKGIDVLIAEVEYLCATAQLPTDYNPVRTANGIFDVGPSNAVNLIVELIESHTKMLIGSTDQNMLNVFNQEVGLRLFTVLCKHIKRQRISLDGSMKLISDMNLFFLYIKTLRNSELLEYFKALRELSQIYLIAPEHAKEMAEVVADTQRFGGIFRAEEVYEFLERRADWFTVKKDVERAMYGIECGIM